MKKNIDIEHIIVSVFQTLLFILSIAEGIYTPTVIILKLSNIIEWPWYIVLLPFEIGSGIAAVCMLGLGLYIIINNMLNR